MRAPARPVQQWLRLVALAAALLLLMLMPFLLWADTLARVAPLWLQSQQSLWLLAVAGIALLVADIALPVPSSIVAIALCWMLGPLWGGVSVAIGCLLAFVAGYCIGRLVPEPRLRQWVGPQLWDTARDSARQRAMWWIVIARPLPLLAELTAVLAGIWRVPLLSALANAAAASAVVGALYGASVWLGREQPALVLTVVVLLALPSLTWVSHRMVLRRWLGVKATGCTPSADAISVHHVPHPRIREEESS